MGKFEPKPGTNVIAKIDGKDCGPYYVLQIVDGVATLQGVESYQVPVSDIVKQA
jgi:hypothetical protein